MGTALPRRLGLSGFPTARYPDCGCGIISGMKFVVILISLCLLLPLPAVAGELRPLSNVLASEQSPAIFSYSLKRCAALYAMMRGALSGTKGQEKLDSDLSDMAVFAMLAAQRIDQSASTQPVTAESIASMVGRIAELYSARWIENRDATGHGSDSFFDGESKTCRRILQELQN